jgi:hypothetical protein
MAGDPDGTLYASATDISRSELYRIDLDDGTATLIGPIVNSPGNIAIAVNAEGQMYGHDIVNDSLISIDKYTGAGTIIGPLGFNANFGQGMDFDYESGICYLAAFNQNTGPELRIADLTTGNTTNVGAFSVNQVGSMAVATEAPPSWAVIPTNQGTIAAGGSGTLDVIFDSNVVSNLGSYYAHLVFYGNFVNNPAPVDCIMHIADGPQLTAPPVIDFGGVYMDTSNSIPLPVKNTGFGVITGGLENVDEPFSTSGDTTYILASLESKELITWFTPTGSGTFNDIAILTGAGNREVLLTGYVLPTLDITPPSVTFPDTEIGETNQVAIICKNIGGDILYGSVTTPASPFSLEGTTNYAIAYNDFVYYVVTFAPQGVMDYSGTLEFTGGGGAVVPLSGHGIPEPGLLWLLLLVCAMGGRKLNRR